MRNFDNKKMQLCLTFSLILLISILPSISGQITPSSSETNQFSIIWITDTQYLSESYPRYYESLCRWIVEKKDIYNVKMVIHTGDIVEDEFNRTHWTNANNAMSILLENNVPYCWNAGNHDYNKTFWIGNQYAAFNPETLSSKLYWVGDKFDGQNTAVKFTVSGTDFLVVNIAYQANNTALDWCNEILDSHPDARAIVGAHVYLNNTSGYGSKGKDDPTWPTNFKDTVLDKHSNVFLTLSGHHYPTLGSRVQVGGRHELMFNRQNVDSGMGAACLRLLSFNLDEGLIDLKTFVIYANTFLEDSNNQYTLESNFYNDAIPEFSFLIVLIVLAIIVPVAILVKFQTKKTLP